MGSLPDLLFAGSVFCLTRPGRFVGAAQGAGCGGSRLGFIRVVLPAAGLPCDARGEVGPQNSLRGCAAALKQLRPVR